MTAMPEDLDNEGTKTRQTPVATVTGQIGRNTAALYFRMILLLAADVVSVRLAIEALGVPAYGRFAAIAVIVSTLRFLNGKLEETSLRFQSADPRGSEALASSGLLALLLGLAMALLGETTFRWFAEAQTDLAGSASVFHLGVAVAVLKTVRIPLVTLLLAHSRRRALVGFSCVEALAAVGAAALVFSPPLRTVDGYASLLLTAELLTTLTAAVLCRRAVRIGLPNLVQLRVQGTFFGWSSLSAVANAIKYQGVCALLVRLAGTAYAATWRVTMNLGFGLYGVIGFFQQAYATVLVRLWTTGDRTAFRRVLLAACGWSALLMAAFTVPILLFAEPLVALWMGAAAPPETAAFLRCVAAHFLIDSLAAPLHAAIAATGRIARYQVAVSLTMGSGFVLAGTALLCGLPAWSAMAAVAFSNVLAVLCRLVYVRRFIFR